MGETLVADGDRDDYLDRGSAAAEAYANSGTVVDVGVGLRAVETFANGRPVMVPPRQFRSQIATGFLAVRHEIPRLVE